MIQQFHFWVFTQRRTQKCIHTPMLTAALFIIAKAWRPPKYQLMDEQIKKYHTHPADYHSSIKKKI